MLHKEIPFIRLLVPLSAGIASAYFSEGGIRIAFAIAILSLLLLVAVALRPPLIRSSRLFGIAISLFLFSAGFILLRKELSYPLPLDEKNEAVYAGRVSSFPQKKNASYAFMVKLLAVSGASDTAFSGTRGNMLVYYVTADTTAPEIQPGTIITFVAKAEPFKNRGNPMEFDYASFMLRKGAGYHAFIRPGSVLSVTEPDHRTLRERALLTSRRISGIYLDSGLESRNAGLITALTLGNKEMIDEVTKEDFSRAGIMHVMAVSGLHAGVISMFVFSMLFFLKGRLNVVRVIVSVAVLWAFAFITGLPPSVERASLMFSFLHIGRLLKRPANSINSILASAFIMLLLKPSDLASLSFQLSFSAVIFISLFFRKACNMVRTGIGPVDRILQIAIVSVLAQAGTLPFTLNAFGSLPLWFLPANIIVIPLASLLIITAFILVMVSGLESISELVAYLANILADITIDCAGWLGGLPGPDSGTAFLPWPETILLMLFMWCLMRFLVPEKKRRVLAPLLSLLLLLSASAIRQSFLANTSELIVYNTNEGMTVGMRSGRSIVIISDTISEASPALIHASQLSLRVIQSEMSSLPVIIGYAGLRFMVCDKPDIWLTGFLRPDFLIAGQLQVKPEESFSQPPAQIIVTSGRPGVIITAESDLHPPDLPVHYTRRDGAYMLKLPAAGSKKRQILE